MAAPPSQQAGEERGGEGAHDAGLARPVDERAQAGLGLVPLPSAEAHALQGELEAVGTGGELAAHRPLEAEDGVALGVVETTGPEAAAGGVHARPGRQLVTGVDERELDRPGDVEGAVGVAERQPAAAPVLQGVAAQVGVAQALGQRQRLRRVLDDPRVGLGHGPDGHQVAVDAGDLGVGGCEPGVVAEGLELGQGAFDRLGGGAGPVRPVQGAGEPQEGVGHHRRVAGRLGGDDPPPPVGGGVGEAVDHVEGVRQVAAGDRHRAVGQRGRLGEEQLEVVDGLGVRAEADRLLGGNRGVVDQRPRVARLLGMMDEAGRLDVVVLGQHVEDLLVGPHPCGRGERALHRLAGQLVAEPHVALVAAEDTGPLGLGGGGMGVGQLGQEPALGSGGDDRGVLEQLPGGGAEAVDAAEDRVAHGGRYAQLAGREHLADEERVAAGDGVQLAGGHAAVPGHRGHGVERQRRQGQAAHPLAGQVPEHPAQPVPVAHLLVAVGDDDDRGQRRDPAGQETDHVERGVVGPVQVLDHQHHGGLGEDVGQDAEHLLGVGAAGQGRGQRPAQPVGDVADRAQRPRGDQVIAPAGEHPDAPGHSLVGERPHQGRLAQPGLAGDEHDGATAPRAPGIEGGDQRGQLAAPLQQRRPVAGGGRRRLVVGSPHDRGHEPVPPPVGGADHLLGTPVVAHRPAGVLDAGGEGRLGDEPGTPHRVEQLVLGHHPAGVLDQEPQHVEDLGLHTDHVTGQVATELERAGVELELGEGVDHRPAVTPEER